ncbi:MAG: lipopolysaccharide biosynthesis protein [Hyphomicrobium sp.]|uniref:lipopolysaccharide biosynthesis protein n=1 Tax=Hyphomicrobium sp. TaxID=82 RepID=UPI0039E4CB93
MSDIRRGFFLSSTERYGVLLVNFLTTLVTARLLTPADFGVAIIGFTAFALVDIFREFGGGTYLVQVDDVTPQRAQAVFTIMLFIAFPIAILLFLAAGAIADFYNSPGMVNYLRVTSVCVFLSVFGSPVIALMKRDLKFGRLALMSSVTTILNSAMTITLASLGFSYMSFAWAQLTSSLVYLTLCILWGPSFPVYRFSLTDWRRITNYGIFDTAKNILMSLSEAAPVLVLGKTLGTQGLGLYHRAITVSRLPERTILAGVTPVLLPALAKKVRDGHEIKESFLIGIEYLTVILWPCLFGIIILAHPLVYILLGSQWTSAVPLVRIIAGAYLLSFAMSLPNPTLIAVGAIRDTVILALLVVPVTVTIQVVASLYGVHAVAWSFFPQLLYSVALSMFMVRRRIGFKWSELFSSMKRSAIVAIFVAIAPATIAVLSGGTDQIGVPEFIIAGIAGGLCWLLAVRLTNHPIHSEIERAATAVQRAIITRVPAERKS